MGQWELMVRQQFIKIDCFPLNRQKNWPAAAFFFVGNQNLEINMQLWMANIRNSLKNEVCFEKSADTIYNINSASFKNYLVFQRVPRT
jgi:hypothetical protein